MQGTQRTSRKRSRAGEPSSSSMEHGEMGAASVSVGEDATVVLNVGGTLITTLKSTLCAQPSRFSSWILSDFKEFPRDEDGHPFIDRDVVNFKHIINYMRGYGLPTKSADLVLLAEDAVFYELESLRKEIGMDQPLVWRFNPGPGVASNGMEFCTSNILGVCGTEPLARNEPHTRLFRIDRCERVAIGLIGADSVESIHTDQQLHDQKMSVSYCSTGELIHYWYSDKMYTTGSGFKAQDIIEVRVEFPDESEGPMTSRVLFAPYIVGSGTLPFAPAAIALPPPATVAVPTRTAEEEETASTTPRPQGQAPGSATLGPASAPVTNVDAESALPVYVGPSPSLSHAYSTLNHGTNPADVSGYDTTNGEDVAIGAVITIIKAGKVEFVVHWPQPVPPLHYAVSMQGASSVTLLEAGVDVAPLASPALTATAGSANFPNIPAPPRDVLPLQATQPPPPARPPPTVPRRRVAFDG